MTQDQFRQMCDANVSNETARAALVAAHADLFNYISKLEGDIADLEKKNDKLISELGYWEKDCTCQYQLER